MLKQARVGHILLRPLRSYDCDDWYSPCELNGSESCQLTLVLKSLRTATIYLNLITSQSNTFHGSSSNQSSHPFGRFCATFRNLKGTTSGRLFSSSMSHVSMAAYLSHWPPWDVQLSMEKKAHWTPLHWFNWPAWKRTTKCPVLFYGHKCRQHLNLFIIYHLQEVLDLLPQFFLPTWIGIFHGAICLRDNSI